MTDVSRASNPTGPSLLDKSTAHPGSIDKSIFEKKTGAATGSSVGQGTVNSNYLRECREDNPEPPPPEGTKPQVVFSNCRFLTPLEELRIEEPFEMAVDLKRLGGAAICPTHFMLYSLVTKDGKEKRSYTWRGEGKAVDPQADPVVVKATGKLVSELGTKMQGRAIFELEAEHPYAKEKGRSPRVDVALQVVGAGGANAEPGAARSPGAPGEAHKKNNFTRNILRFLFYPGIFGERRSPKWTCRHTPRFLGLD